MSDGAAQANAPTAGAPRRTLSLLDCTCLTAGIIVGAGIYQASPDVAKSTSSSVVFFGLWLVGGLLSLCGALSYAELATAYPQQGGDYVYLNRAYGPWAGFLFGWIQIMIVRPGDIAVMAFAFASYARAIYDPLAGSSSVPTQQLYAAAAVLTLTVLNIAGVRQGKWTQNILTMAKVLGLLVVIGAAFCAPGASAAGRPVGSLPLSVALILVLFTYGGWNEVAYVAAEVKDPGRNIVRALALGLLAVAGLYLLINFAFIHALGLKGVASSQAVATQAVRSSFGHGAPVIISALVCVSALGAVNGLTFTGARISYAVGRDHRIFSSLGSWSAGRGTPVRALLFQALVALVLVVTLGGFVETLLYTAAPVYIFYLSTSLAVVVLRYKEPGTYRPWRVWGYPLTPLLFAATCAFLVYSATRYKPAVTLAALAMLMAGLPVYWLGRSKPLASA